jgi:glycosyltransferase involved in cell wall biosynthesis
VRICYFGSYDRNSLRTVNNIKALKKAGVGVVECWDRSPMPLRYLRLIKKHRHLQYDVMIVGWYGHSVLPLAKIIAKKPIVLDALIGLYETEVIDRRHIAINSWKASFCHYMDSFHFRLADVCFSDTESHIDYFCKQFNLKKEKFRRIFVTTDDDVYHPEEIKKNDCIFHVLFEGAYTPLHGLEYIIQAAKLLENNLDIKFELIGEGQTYKEIRALYAMTKSNNIDFLPWMDYYTKLPDHIATTDVCLGIFGDGVKARKVIPTKVVDALAMKKPLITGDSPAAREVFRHMDNCMLVPMANPKALAEAILTLKNDDDLRKKIANNGYKLYKERFSLEVIGQELKANLLEIID